MVRGISSQPGDRYVATNTLDAVMTAQGRKQAWLAARLGVSTSLLCLIIGGARTVDRARGDLIAATLGVPFGLLFKLHSRRDVVTDVRKGPPAVAPASPPDRPRLVVHQGDRQRVLRPATGARPRPTPRSDTAGRAPPA
jgi:hypothetical protein